MTNYVNLEYLNVTNIKVASFHKNERSNMCRNAFVCILKFNIIIIIIYRCRYSAYIIIMQFH